MKIIITGIRELYWKWKFEYCIQIILLKYATNELENEAAEIFIQVYENRFCANIS